jgi:hypothetical protein
MAASDQEKDRREKLADYRIATAPAFSNGASDIVAKF